MRPALPLFRPLFYGAAALAVFMAVFLLFHLGGVTWEFTQLTGAILGGILTIFSARIPILEDESVEPWLGNEQVAWTLIGCGLIMWGGGEAIWRYYVLTNQSPFPSYADLGYSALPPLVFIGLLLQPSSGVGRSRLLTTLDSFIAMGSLLSIGWFLLLGSLAFASAENVLAKFLGLYYPTSDIALLSCIVLLLLRGQGRLYQTTARSVSLIIIGIGLSLFAVSDFIFNIQQAAGTYVDGTWIDLGWPFGLMIIGLAAYLRRFLPLTSSSILDQRVRRRADQGTFGPAQMLTYILLGILLLVLLINVFSTDKLQVSIRPVLLLATVVVVGLVVARQVFTLLENERLARRQRDALDRLEDANRKIEEQAQRAAQRSEELEVGVLHLKDVQARLANGNLRARANLSGGALMPLAVSLNLMAERLARMEQSDTYAQGMARALQELSATIEQYKLGKPFAVPALCRKFPEINQLLQSLELQELTRIKQLPNTPVPSEAVLPNLARTSRTAMQLRQEPNTQRS